jgi:pimeloyl-ACP methyl ester carboxylesterase
LHCIHEVPSPLVRYYAGGDTIKDVEDWEAYRPWIKVQAEHWLLGKQPPKPPKMEVEITAENDWDKHIERKITLHFFDSLRIRLVLSIPKQAKPAPVFMTQWNHKGWAAIALRRGYATCVYAAADALDDTENYRSAFPDYDLGVLMARAYGASRVLDYLHQVPELDTNRIAITGHSRNGKQSLFVAAFDERVDAVIVSGGGVSPIRTHEKRYNTHDLERTLIDFPEWFSPRLKQFVGQPQKLPIDFNYLFALVAPRACLVSTGLYDLYADSYGTEASYRSVQPVYDLYQANDALNLRQVVGRHLVTSRDVEAFVDFLDTQFGRKDFPAFQDQIHHYDFAKWQANLSDAKQQNFLAAINKAQPEGGQVNVEQVKKLLLGDAPAQMPYRPQGHLPNRQRTDHIAEIIRGNETIGKHKRIRIAPYNTIGDYISADLYLPESAGDEPSNLSVVLYLHDFTYSYGYAKQSYPGFSLEPRLEALLDSGFAVLAFDLPGFGARQKEITHFYERYSDWSLLGKMVSETQDMLHYLKQLSIIDTSKIHALGVGLGGTVLGFLPRKAQAQFNQILLVNPFHGYQNTDSCKEGLAQLYDYHPLVPQMGLIDAGAFPFGFQDLWRHQSSRTHFLFTRDCKENQWSLIAAMEAQGLDVHSLDAVEGSYFAVLQR